MVGSAGTVVANLPACYDQTTMTDVLDTAGVSWRYYTNQIGGILDAPNAIRHMCQATMVGKNMVCRGPAFTNGQIVGNSPKILTDIMSGNLQAVTWVNPPTIASDHPLV